MVTAIALGVGSLTGIKGFSEALDRAMARSARELVAADLAVRMNGNPNAREQEILETLVKRGCQLTRITETLSMASSMRASRPILSNIKAVDPKLYPFYGDVGLDPPLPLKSVLADDAAVVSPDFLARTNLSPGAEIQIGTGRFRIAGVLKSEPDRLASGVELGPRILITRNGLNQSGLIQFGSRATESFLFRLPGKGFSLEEAREILKMGLQRRARISDYRDPNPALSRGLERTASFLSLIGLLALLVAGLGIATTIHTYLQQRLDSIAIMKCLGGRSVQILRIYLLQGLCLGIIGSLLGVALGYFVQLAFPPLLRGLLELPTQLELAPGAALQGFAVGITATLLFLLPPLLAIRKVRPARVFLREMPETYYSTIQRLRHDWIPLAFSLLLLFGAGVLASWLAWSWRQGFGFMAGLAGAILVLSAGTKVLLVVLKRLPRPSSLAFRHGLKNLNRPGSHVASVLVALGIGVAFILTVYLIQTSLLSQIVKSAPANLPNVFLLGITGRDKDPLQSFLQTQHGVADGAELIPSVPSRLERVDGKAPEEMNLDPHDRRFSQMEFMLTWTSKLPPNTKVLEGQWWPAPYSSPMISVAEGAARALRIRVGSTLEFDSSGRRVRGKVVNIREIEFGRPGSSNQFIFSPGALEGLPASYIGALRMAPSEVPGFQSALFARFPVVTSIDAGQVLARVQQLLDKITSVIRFIALFAILAGVIMLASSVVATRYQRIREAVLLKTLGATRAQIARIQAAEFLIIGLAAGLIGCLLAAAAANFLLGRLLETEFSFRWMPLLTGTLATTALAIMTGWIASRGVLNHKPLEILREN
ncbi:MAG TPA: FtsX-like permease family protein [Acidobacteriota bacterium]|nr:FtsX-like permease family protein [Acidobacteriota bacterium]